MSAVTGSPAEYRPVRNTTRTGHPHVAHGYDARAEGDVAIDRKPAAAAQRWRPGRKPLLEAGQQAVEVLVQRDHGPRTGEAGAHLPVAGELIGVGAHDEQIVGGLYRGEPRAGDVDRPGAGERAAGGGVRPPERRGWSRSPRPSPPRAGLPGYSPGRAGRRSCDSRSGAD